MSIAQSLRIQEVLTKHFGNTQDANIVVTEIEQIVEDKLERKSSALATKQDLSDAKLDMIKWMVGFWLTQMAAIVALFFKK